MKKILVITALTLMIAPQVWAGEHRIGGGANYWVAVEDIDSQDADDDGFSYLASYQYVMDFVAIELDVEFLPDRFGETALAPEAYFLLGKAIYAGAGLGIVHADGGFADEPFFALRGGLNLEILPEIYLDVSANYRFNDSADLDGDESDIDTDTVFLGAAVRFSL